MKRSLIFALALVLVPFAAPAVAQENPPEVKPPREKVLHVEDIPTHDLWGVIHIRAIMGEMTMMVFNDFDKGANITPHNHPSEQITYILKGRLRFMVEDREHILGPGDIIVVPSFVKHGAVALEDTTTIEAFAPIRNDWRDFAR